MSCLMYPHLFLKIHSPLSGIFHHAGCRLQHLLHLTLVITLHIHFLQIRYRLTLLLLSQRAVLFALLRVWSRLNCCSHSKRSICLFSNLTIFEMLRTLLLKYGQHRFFTEELQKAFFPIRHHSQIAFVSSSVLP